MKVILVVVLSVFLAQFSVGSALARNAPDIDRKPTKNRPLPELPDLSGSEVPDSSAPEVLPNSPAEARPKGAEHLSTLFLRRGSQANQRYDLEKMKKFDDEVYGDR
ncbi:hypothetical protein QUA08_28255 [Microcoleus sp. T3B2]|uniref:hypothetical protein n=1 Tax=Microcoleus sp. T3B2 TaxID=3055426 RepID=UPI002FD39552